MIVSDKAINLIKNFEGFSPAPYVCPAGFLTIGYGHKIPNKDKTMSEISEEEATKLLNDDIKIIQNTIYNNVKVSLTQGQFDALVSLIYNWGSGNFIKSKGLKKLNNGDYAGALLEFQEVIYVNRKRFMGLVRRRLAEKLLWNGETIDESI